ncbi:hypothetical protein [Kineosporia sp. NBRC 101731]|uniref:hypothetical protein n=1 Tax=Kineosporia sp. NBRC 101731 TaxID=3032199 RepID=UPI0024A58965|nr:hypothetical protein [Kineosporia sp. NBRC 101731]GLY31899.1 hypothetical protein Kisp02_52640 [Kineosporia sp. NBRC 101731]
MSRSWIVTSPEPGSFQVTLEQFRSAISYWGPDATLSVPPDDHGTDAYLDVNRPGQPGFLVIHYRRDDMLSTDGTQEQAAEFAVWAMQAFSATGELWLVDQGYSGHVVLTPDMTPADVMNGWQEH